MRTAKHDKKAAQSTLKTDTKLKSIFATPHTVSALCLAVLALLYLAFYVKNNSVICGVVVAYCVFLLISLLQFSDSVFKRPHPAFWRLVKGSSIFYLLILVIVLFCDKKDVRQFLSMVDSNLGKKLAEKSYGADCALTFRNIYDAMDMYVPAHLFGWYFKALMLRDYYLCWILSVAFELCEYTFAYQLPNFNECWWDHWILDIATCNAIGIHFGIKTCHYFNAKVYRWRGNIDDNPLGLLHWISSADTFKKYVGLLCMIFLILGAEMNTFYLKALLWIPADHYLNIIRLVLYILMGTVAIREGYSYFSDKTCKSFGYQLWTCIAIICVEMMICVKYAKNEFHNTMPRSIKIFWMGVFSFIAIFPVYRYFLKDKLKRD